MTERTWVGRDSLGRITDITEASVEGDGEAGAGFDGTSLADYTADAAILLRTADNLGAAADELSFRAGEGAGGDGARLSVLGGGELLPGTVEIVAPSGLIYNGGLFTRAEFVANGSTVDQLRDALIAAGLMEAS